MNCFEVDLWSLVQITPNRLTFLSYVSHRYHSLSCALIGYRLPQKWVHLRTCPLPVTNYFIAGFVPKSDCRCFYVNFVLILCVIFLLILANRLQSTGFANKINKWPILQETSWLHYCTYIIIMWHSNSAWNLIYKKKFPFSQLQTKE